jgi:lactate 2-monooxygenase
MNPTALDWQKEIYLNGFAGQKLKTKIDFFSLEQQARKCMSRKAFAYIAGGAGREETMHANVAAYQRYRIVPRMLCDVGRRDTSITLFGRRLPTPMLVSPIGVLEMAHRDADIAVARAAASLGIPMIISNQASRPMEQIAASMGDSPRWFQLYWSKSHALVESFLQRAAHCGCEAIVVTLDTTMLGWRVRDLDLAYLPFLEGMGIAQYTSDPVFQRMLDEPADGVAIKRKISMKSLYGLYKMVKHYPGNGFFGKLRSGRPVKAVRKFIETYSNPCTTWNDLAYLRKATTLPILLKGVLNADDARKAIGYGMDGIIVSNHGGRQVDGAVSALEMLPVITDIVKGSIPVLADSGVRGGADVFKAVALGATAVCIGRPYAYGLAVAGERGVFEVLNNFRADFELTMGLSGCKSVAEIDRTFISQ